jgi:hypothetical protein
MFPSTGISMIRSACRRPVCGREFASLATLTTSGRRLAAASAAPPRSGHVAAVATDASVVPDALGAAAGAFGPQAVTTARVSIPDRKRLTIPAGMQPMCRACR